MVTKNIFYFLSVFLLSITSLSAQRGKPLDPTRPYQPNQPVSFNFENQTTFSVWGTFTQPDGEFFALSCEGGEDWGFRDVQYPAELELKYQHPVTGNYVSLGSYTIREKGTYYLEYLNGKFQLYQKE
jgi:hypothetical protein